MIACLNHIHLGTILIINIDLDCLMKKQFELSRDDQNNIKNNYTVTK